MMRDITSPVGDAAATELFLGEDWFDPLEAGVRTRIRAFIEALLEAELEAALSRKRYERRAMPETGSGDEARSAVSGHRHGHRGRSVMGTFGAVTVRVPRARLATPAGGTKEWRNASLPAYQRMTRRAEALIAGAYLSGTNTRRVRRALAALFGGAVGKDVVSRVWRKVKTDWDAWNRRDLSAEPIIRLILDGTMVRVRLDRKATAISLLVVLGVRQDGQKVLLAVKNMGGESEAAWRAILDDLVARGLRTPELVVVDGASGLEKALAALWPDVPTQRCTVHKHRNLLAHAPDRLHEEISADYTDMIYAASAAESMPRARRRWPSGAERSCASGGSSAEPWPTAWRRPGTGSSPSPVCRQANGSRPGPRMQWSACTRSSSGGSRPRLCCPRPRPQPCCFGRCWLQARSR
jgi:putative transposase